MTENLQLARQELYRALEQIEIAADKISIDDPDRRRIVALCGDVEEVIAALDKVRNETAV
jgi:ABC-type hemin transport system substrate-binding protein